MKVIIAGGRNYHFTAKDNWWLDDLSEIIDITEVVSGGAPGADAGGASWANGRKIPVKVFPAYWETRGKRAGPYRNEEMAKYADAVVLFPGGRGTADMKRRALRHGLPVFTP